MFAGIRAYGATRSAQISYTNDKKVKQTWKVNSKMFKDLWIAETLVYEHITKTEDKIYLMILVQKRLEYGRQQGLKRRLCKTNN